MGLNSLPLDIRPGVETFIKKYKPQLTVDNFHSHGIVFNDELGQRTVVVAGKFEGNYISFVKGNADVFIIAQDEALLGWVHKNATIESDKTLMMPKGSLNKMPKKMKFAQDCPHISYYGGYSFNDEHVICFGCGKVVV